MKVDRVYTEEVPIWRCKGTLCGFMFHIEGFALTNHSMSWGNSESIPYCPRCGYTNCELMESFPEFSDE